MVNATRTRYLSYPKGAPKPIRPQPLLFFYKKKNLPVYAMLSALACRAIFMLTSNKALLHTKYAILYYKGENKTE